MVKISTFIRGYPRPLLYNLKNLIEAITCFSLFCLLNTSSPATANSGPDALYNPSIECARGIHETEHTVQVKRNGRFTKHNLTGSHRFDATDAIFNGIESDKNTLQPWPIAIKVAKNARNAKLSARGCWYGGIVKGAWDENGHGVEQLTDGREITWEHPYHHSGGITVEMSHFLIEDISILSHGDGIRSYGNNNVIDGAYVADIHDDCVENDALYSLLIKDSFFDGCYVGISARAYTDGHNGSDNLLELRDSLIRLEPQPTVYEPEKYGKAPGHGQFFKWTADPTIALKLAIHNSIFLATQQNRHGGGLGVEEVSNLESCSNNVMVWTGEGAFPNAEKLPACFRLSTDYAEWEAAVVRWRKRYPGRPRHP